VLRLYSKRNMVHGTPMLELTRNLTRARIFKCLWGPGIDSKE
jgi:hypothetical protein